MKRAYLDRLVDLIKQECDRRLLKQATLAEKAGISRQRVNAVFVGNNRSRDTIKAMLVALDMFPLPKDSDAPR